MKKNKIFETDLRLICHNSDSSTGHSGKTDNNIFCVIGLNFPKFVQIDNWADDILNIVRSGAFWRNDRFKSWTGTVSWIRAVTDLKIKIK